jgi:SNF2 family DNA or RNA helicase
MNGGERREAINFFRNDPYCNVILVSLKCGSLGLNLTAANHVIMCDLWWNPAVENQAIDRAHRMGQVTEEGFLLKERWIMDINSYNALSMYHQQEKPVYVHRLTIKDTIEERIMNLQEQKKRIADSVLGEGTVRRQGAARLNIQDLMMLFRDHN